MSAAPCRQGRGGGRSARAPDTAHAGGAGGGALQDSPSAASRPLGFGEHTFGCSEKSLRDEQANDLQPLHAEGRGLPCLQQRADDVVLMTRASNGDYLDTATSCSPSPRTLATRGRGGRTLVSSRCALIDGWPLFAPGLWVCVYFSAFLAQAIVFSSHFPHYGVQVVAPPAFRPRDLILLKQLRCTYFWRHPSLGCPLQLL
jgi:hypothetical protein